MFMKIAGALLLILGGGGLGMYYGLACEFRKRELEEFKRALMLMYSETQFGHTHLSGMCERAAKICAGAVADILHGFALALKDKSIEDIAAVWRSHVQRGAADTHLSAEDFDKISALGEGLGSGDINRQLNSINQLITYIDMKNTELERLGEKNLRLYKSTGVLIGIFAVILLI